MQNFNGTPIELRSYDQWVCWRYEKRDNSITKVPLCPSTGNRASVTDPSTWGTFKQAVYGSANCAGIGFVFTANDPFAFIDLDDCKDDAEAIELQSRISASFPSYAERSPSGKGAHIIVRGSVPRGRRRGKVEIYSNERYATMTGFVINEAPIVDCQQNLTVLWNEMGGEKAAFDADPFFRDATETDNAILARAFRAANGAKFQRLWNGQWQGDYPSQSEADFALIDNLGFYSQNPEQIVRLFRQCGLGQRTKANRDTYVMPMVRKAMDRQLAPVPHNLQFGTPLEAPAAMPTIIDAGTWAGAPIPPRLYLWANWITAGQLTYLTGPGASGKSLLCQSLATSTALGRAFLGQQTMRGVALYLTCEDDASELQRRQGAICAALGVSVAELRGWLGIVSLTGAIGNELATFDRSGVMHVAPAYHWLANAIRTMNARLVVLDNVAHLFPGNENDRHQVAAFVGLLNSLAIETGAAIILIGHPNKSGADYSGSTAWENQVRTRLFLGIPHNADGSIPDLDARVLTRAKFNYGRGGEALTFRWHNHAFIADSDLPPDVGAAIAASIKANAENEAFLACLAKATEEKRAVSPNSSASNFAPRIFAQMPTARGIGRAGFEAAMQRLLHAGTVLNAQQVYRRDNRQWVTGLGIAPTLAPTPAPTVEAGCTYPPSEMAHLLHQGCTNPLALTPLYLTDISGAPSGECAPLISNEGVAP